MGKVVMENSSDPFPVDAVVVLQCGNSERASADVDHKGQFSLVLGRGGSALGHLLWGPAASDTGWSDCALHAQASGYGSGQLSLAGERLNGIVQVGTIILHPLVRATAGGKVLPSAQLPACRT